MCSITPACTGCRTGRKSFTALAPAPRPPQPPIAVAASRAPRMVVAGAAGPGVRTPLKSSGSALESWKRSPPSGRAGLRRRLRSRRDGLGQRVLLAVEAGHEAAAADLAARLEQRGRRARGRATGTGHALAQRACARKTTPVRRSSRRATNSRVRGASRPAPTVGTEQAPAAARQRRPLRRRAGGQQQPAQAGERVAGDAALRHERAQALLDRWRAAAGAARASSWAKTAPRARSTAEHLRGRRARGSARTVAAASAVQASSSVARDERDRRAADRRLRPRPRAGPRRPRPLSVSWSSHSRW